uniref:Uncharacterized protein n=1 Tax=Plectus sambesii TaxID=2011161 RepID=A0A914VS48_9BILA
MASSTDTILRSDDFCNSGIYPFVVRDIERMHQLILEDDDDDDDGVAANADEEEEFLWFLPRADESKSEFLGRAKIIGDNRRATQDKKKSPSPAKSAQPHYQSLEAAAPYASSSSTPSSSEAAAAAIVRTSKYGMRCLNMGAGHYRKMVRISTTIASSSSHRVVSSRFKAANALRNAAVAAARLPTASTNLLPPSSSVLPADNAPTQTKDPLTHDQLYAQLKELMSQRYRQFLVEAGAKVDDRLLDDIFQSPINEDEDACEANSATVCNAAVEIDSSGPPAVTSPAPHSADSAAFSPQVDASASPISTERQRRARHSNDHCRTCPGCRATAPKTSMIALAALAASNLPLSAVSSPSTKDRPASSGGSALAAPSNDNRSCACCQRTSVTRRFEWSECEAMCDDCAQPYADFIDDPVGTIVRRRCSDQCKRKLEQQSDAQRCESCHYWSSVDAVRDVIDKRRPPRPTVDNDVIRVNRRKQSMPTSDSKPKPRSETTFVPIYESDDVKELYDLTGPRLRHVCRTSPLAKKTQSLSLSFLPLS